MWQKAHHITLEIYRLSKPFPKEELFGLTSQLRRAALSIENNIAEGFGRRTKKDFASFLHNSLGSLYETHSMLHVAYDLGLMPESEYHTMCNQSFELRKILKTFISKLRTPHY